MCYREGNQLLVSHAYGECNTASAWEHLSASGCACYGKSFFIFPPSQWGGKLLCTPTLFSWGPKKGICSVHCISNTLLILQKSYLQYAGTYPHLRHGIYSWERTLCRELSPLISLKFKSLWKANSSSSNHGGSKLSKVFPSLRFEIEFCQSCCNVSPNHLACPVPLHQDNPRKSCRNPAVPWPLGPRSTDSRREWHWNRVCRTYLWDTTSQSKCLKNSSTS